jgi:hypothetical protein
MTLKARTGPREILLELQGDTAAATGLDPRYVKNSVTQ